MWQKCWADDVKIRRKHTPSLSIYESIVQRSAWETRWWKIVDTLLRRLWETIETVFRTIISASQLSLFGAVAEMCEECESCHDRTERPVVKGQSDRLFVPSVIKTNTPLNDDPAQEEDPLQKCRERIEKLSQQDRVSKICTDAGYLTAVEVGQYFMTKDTESSYNSQIQWPVVSTPCQETKVYLNQKVGFVGTPRLDPHWKLPLVTCKVNMEWKSQLSLWTKTILTSGSEFLMAWINWSQTWTTKTKTTTSRKPQKCSSKTLR